ncbi:MAG: hypothetical protein Q9222_004356 [Ikaeria aurantiellina]
MEHLHLPKHAASPGPEDVPYVCAEGYDNGPFLTFPSRQGKTYILEAPSESKYRATIAISTPLAELEAFIQTWLFFGLLNEILKDMCTASQFVTVVNPSPTSRRRIDTTSLVSIVQGWVNHVKVSDDSDEERQAQYNHIAECLQLTMRVLIAIRPSSRPDFNRSVIVSIASVAELLTAATNSAYKIRDLNSQNKCPGTWAFRLHDDPKSAEMMKQHGYCPSEIIRIKNTCITLSTIHFLTWMDKTDPAASHEHCNDSECLWRSNSLSSDKTKHRLDHCDCSSLTVDVGKAIAILARGGLPILSLTSLPPRDDIRLEVLEAVPESRYVAISHIWADGLGNAKANELPRCQLQHLLKLTTSFFESSTTQADGSTVLIWLDTLCVPVKPPEARTMALNQMKRPYIEAAFVLVLDAGLCKIHSQELDPLETGLRIFNSQWMRRLWTLQEGALPDKLYFQFSDATVDLQQLQKKVLDIHQTDIGRQYLALDVGTAHAKLRGFFHSSIPAAGPDLATAVQALHYRSVSEPADEPLLMAGLLQLDARPILNGPDSSRMQRLWTLMPLASKGIPMNVIFRSEPRLSQPGFRWAPRTFLTSDDDQGFGLSSSFHEDRPTILTSAGLQVRFPGCHIDMPAVPEGLPKNPWNMFRNVDANDISCRYVDGTWFHMKIDDKVVGSWSLDTRGETLRSLLGDRSKRYGVVLSAPFQFEDDAFNRAYTGLLVHYKNDEGALSTVHSEVPIIIGIKRGATGILFEAAWEVGQLLLKDEITGQFMSLGIDDEDQQKQDPEYSALVGSLEQTIRSVTGSIVGGPVHDALQVYNQQTNAYALFHAVIASFYLGSYANLGTMSSNDTCWCVD